MHLRSKAKKMHILAFSHVLRRLVTGQSLCGNGKTLLRLVFEAAPWLLGWEKQQHSPWQGPLTEANPWGVVKSASVLLHPGLRHSWIYSSTSSRAGEQNLAVNLIAYYHCKS